MYTYVGLTPDLHLVAIGVVVWVVAVSVAFGVYVPVLQSDGKLLRGFAPRRRLVGVPAYAAAASLASGDLDHAPLEAVPTIVAEPVSVCAADRQCPDAFSVLIVDDNAINRQVLELILDSVGVAHASVENGLEAVRAMEGCAYDAVLMDLQMPVMDGFEATRRIRALEIAAATASARIIVVSANCAPEDVAASAAAGGDVHLAKPISAAAVLAELAACPTANRMAA